MMSTNWGASPSRVRLRRDQRPRSSPAIGAAGTARAKARSGSCVYFEARRRCEARLRHVVMNRCSFYPNDTRVVHQNRNGIVRQFTLPAMAFRHRQRARRLSAKRIAATCSTASQDASVAKSTTITPTGAPDWVNEMKKIYKLGAYLLSTCAWGDGRWSRHGGDAA